MSLCYRFIYCYYHLYLHVYIFTNEILFKQNINTRSRVYTCVKFRRKPSVTSATTVGFGGGSGWGFGSSLLFLLKVNLQNQPSEASVDSSESEVVKLLSCSTQLSMKFFLLINVKMPTIVGILTFMSRKNSILGLSESEKKSEFLDIFILMSI